MYKREELYALFSPIISVLIYTVITCWLIDSSKRCSVISTFCLFSFNLSESENIVAVFNGSFVNLGDMFVSWSFKMESKNEIPPPPQDIF